MKKAGREATAEGGRPSRGGSSSSSTNSQHQLQLAPVYSPSHVCQTRAQLLCCCSRAAMERGQQEKVTGQATASLFPIFRKDFRPPKEPLKILQLPDSEGPLFAKRPRKTLLTQERDGLSQMVLDAGQKRIGPRECPTCGMLYSPGDFEDEETHRKAHLSLMNTFSFNLGKDTRVLMTYPDSTLIVQFIPNVDGRRSLKRLDDFLQWLDSEVAGSDPEASVTSLPSSRILLYCVRTKRKGNVKILGCVASELPTPDKITSFPLVEIPEKHEGSSGPSGTKVILGITRLWVDSSWRRKGVASKMIETLRFHSGVLGLVVPKESIAILEPSAEGKAFMTKFTGGKGHVYTHILNSERSP